MAATEQYSNYYYYLQQAPFHPWRVSASTETWVKLGAQKPFRGVTWYQLLLHLFISTFFQCLCLHLLQGLIYFFFSIVISLRKNCRKTSVILQQKKEAILIRLAFFVQTLPWVASLGSFSAREAAAAVKSGAKKLLKRFILKMVRSFSSFFLFTMNLPVTFWQQFEEAREMWKNDGHPH